MSHSVSAHLFSTVNGVVEAPNLWQFDRFGPEEGEMMGRTIGAASDVVIGRKLWQEWHDYWQNAGDDDPFAAFINPVRKHVLSRSGIADRDWNSSLVTGDPVAYIRRLADTADATILVPGGIDTIRGLFLAGAIDTLTLTVHPVVTGNGRRLFDDTVPTTRLDLVDHQVTASGNAILTYRLRP